MFKFIYRGIETLRQPDRNPRCYEMTDEERLEKIHELSTYMITILRNDN